MANKLYEIAFELGAKLDSTFNGAFGEAAKKINSLKIAAGAAAIGAGIGAGVSFADDLQKSLNGLQVATGSSDEAMQGMKDSLVSIYNNNFGESFQDIGSAMATVGQQSGLTGKALEGATQNALLLRDAFGFEVNESFRSAKMMTDQFGISTENAYNLMAQGAQKGLDKNGDLLDSINEYSVHFKQMGFNSDEMFNMLANGAATGTFSVDKLGDAVKEFGIRSKDGSKGTMDAFQQLGLDANKLSSDFATGGSAGKAAFDTVNKALLATKDPLLQNQIGTALWGTMWEDLGVAGISALTNVNGSISSTKNALQAMNSIKYNSFGEAIEGIKRQLQTGILLPIGEAVLPLMNKFANFLNSNIPSAIGIVKGVLSSLGNGFNSLIAPFLNMIDQGDSVSYAFWMSFQNVFGQQLTQTISDFIGYFEFGIKGLIAFIQGDVGKAGNLFYAMFPDEAGTQGKVNIIIGGLNLVKEGIGATIATAKDLGGYIINNWGSIETIVKGIALGITAYKIAQLGLNAAAKAGLVIQTLTKAIEAGKAVFEMYRMGATVASIAQWALNAAMAANPAMVIALGVVALVGVILLLVKSWDKVKAVMSSFWGWIQQTFSGIGAWFSGVFNKAVSGIVGAFSGIGSWISGIFNNIKAVIQVALVAIGSFFVAIWSSIISALSPVLNGIATIVGAVFNVIRGIFITGIEALIVIFKAILIPISFVFNGIVQCVSFVVSAIVATWNQLVGFIVQIWQGIVTFLTPIIQGIANIVTGVFEGIKIALMTYINFYIMIFQMGIAAIQVVIQGISTTVSNVVAWIAAQWQYLVGVISQIWQQIIATIQTFIALIGTLFQPVIDGICASWQGFLGFMTGIWDGISSGASAVVSNIMGVFSPLIGWLEEKFASISNAWSGVKSFLGVDVESKGVGGSLASKAGQNAGGTDYWRGGLTWVGEKGPELVNLPTGAQVIPNNKVQNAISDLNNSGAMQARHKANDAIAPEIKTNNKVQNVISDLNASGAIQSGYKANDATAERQSAPVVKAPESIINTNNNKANGEISVMYSPVNNFYGEANKNQIDEVNKSSFDDFESRFKALVKQERRLSYE